MDNPNTDIRALQSGRVTYIGHRPGNGKVVEIQFMRHRRLRRSTFTARHLCMDVIAVRPNIQVTKGDLLGWKRGLDRPVTVFNERGRQVKSLIYKGV